jgi:hypothetical protein
MKLRLKENNDMTWDEIKQAVEKAGINGNVDITEIQCASEGGDKKFQVIRIGNKIKLSESYDQKARAAAAGCAT